MTIPLSAVVGCLTGGVICVGIYIANRRMKSTVGLSIFTVSLLIILSTGLFSGGCHKFEMAYGFTPIVWKLEDEFWSVDRLPMTIFKPFGYSDTRTLLQMVTFWGYFLFSLLLHYRKYKLCRKPSQDDSLSKDDGDHTADSPEGTPSASAYDASSRDGSKVGNSIHVGDVEEGDSAERRASM